MRQHLAVEFKTGYLESTKTSELVTLYRDLSWIRY